MPGSQVILLFLLCGATFLLSGCNALQRTYYITAEEGTWNYAPMGMDGISGVSFDGKEHDGHMKKRDAQEQEEKGTDSMMMSHDASTYTLKTSKTIGLKYRKARYYRYTDATFTQKWKMEGESMDMEMNRWTHLGILGPAIYCEVGDTVEIVFKNKATQPYSIHVHGLQYQKDSEGSPKQKGEKMDKGVVHPGDSYTYYYDVVERSGPGPNDPSSIVWLYHSHVDSVADSNSGLVGGIVVARAGELEGNEMDPKVRGVDREFITLFNIFDENFSHYLWYNMKKTFGKDRAKKINQENALFVESNRKYTINGLLYGNLEGLEAMEGEHVRWYIMALGDDPHTAHWHGQTLLEAGMRKDVSDLLPAQTHVLDMWPDTLGDWEYHCHIDHHIHAGMTALFNVKPIMA